MNEKTASPTIDEPVMPPSGEAFADSPGQASRTAPFRYFKRRVTNMAALAASDTLALVLGITAAGLVRLLWKGLHMIPEWSIAIIFVWIIGALAVGLLPGWGLGAVEEFRRTTLLIGAVFSVVAIGLFLSQYGSNISRLTLTLTMVVAGPLALMLRNLTKKGLIKLGKWGLPTVIYGAAETGQLAVRALKEEQGLGLIPVGIFEEDLVAGTDTVDGVPVLGGIWEATHIAPAAIVAMTDIPRHQLIELLEGPLATYHRVVIIPDLLEAPSLWVAPRDIGGILGLEVSHNLLDPLARMIKRGFELTLIIATAPLWLLLLTVLSLLIWVEDRRNPFYTQERVGRDNKTFHTLKFRTMVIDSEQALTDALEADPALRKEWEAGFKLKTDPRITRIGRILRRTSLDEFPQLVNVLAGHMSLVGPRPLPRYHYDELPEQLRRLRERVRPGITGLWQVSGRSESGNAGMVRWDSYYVRNWSIWLDGVILVRTFRAVVQGKGAY